MKQDEKVEGVIRFGDYEGEDKVVDDGNEEGNGGKAGADGDADYD